MNTHKSFILTPITSILESVVSASAGIGKGIETYPLCDYIMQSVFLKMTGAQEQKMKCICWELASNDFEYRRILLANDDKLGECSSYSDKARIYKRIIAQIKKNNPDFAALSDDERKKIKNDVFGTVEHIFIGTNLMVWVQRNFIEFQNERTSISYKQFASENNLLESVLQDKYKMLYDYRNRCAHNTPSYQQNLPTFRMLISEDQKYNNYFMRFFLLILIDQIFILLYDKYLNELRSNI